MRMGQGGNRWVIVLSGGNGERLAPLVRLVLGKAVPKQYCAFSGSRTMLEHTYDRALALAPEERVVTVIGRDHRCHLNRACRPPGRIVEQPANLDTAPGIFLPAAYVRAADPDATVVILPSDHFIRPQGRFTMRVELAALWAERLPGRLILLAAEAEGPETDYGWIEPGWRLSEHFGAVPREAVRFHEKPSASDAKGFHRRGFLWNTFIIACKVRTLWTLGRRLLPGLMAGFDAFSGSLGEPDEAAALEALYRGMPSVNFSKAVLERAQGRIGVLPLEGVEWDDWGRPERVESALARLGREMPVWRPATARVPVLAHA